MKHTIDKRINQLMERYKAGDTSMSFYVRRIIYLQSHAIIRDSDKLTKDELKEKYLKPYE